MGNRQRTRQASRIGYELLTVLKGMQRIMHTSKREVNEAKVDSIGEDYRNS